MALASPGSSHLGMTDNQKRWLIVGIALNKILLPQIRPFVERELAKEYSNLRTSHNIHAQSTSGRLQRWPPGKLLKYENINGNSLHPKLPGGKYNFSLFDCRVLSHVDFAKLYVENFMAKFNAFDDHCNASAVLALLGSVPVFSVPVQAAAADVRGIRNAWVHCVFSKWDLVKCQQSFVVMESMVRVMAPTAADEGKLLLELKYWETAGILLCGNSPVDPALLQIVLQGLKFLQDNVDNLSVESDEENVQEQQNTAATLQWMKQMVERLSDFHARAEDYKNKGKDEFRKKDFHSAINYFTEGIKVNCKDKELTAKLYSNRAAAHIELGNYSDALSDAKIAIFLQPSYMKAFFRGAIACFHLKKLNEAIKWCDNGLAIEQNNQELLELRVRSVILLKEEEEEEETFKTGNVNADNKIGKAYGIRLIAHESLGGVIKDVGYHDRCLQIAKTLDDKSLEERAYGNLGNAHYSLGDFKRAKDYYEQQLKIAKELGDSSGEGQAYGNLSNAYLRLGELETAISFLDRELAIAKDMGDRSRERRLCRNLGNTYRKLGNLQTAIGYLKRDLKIAVEVGDRMGEERAYGNLGNLYHNVGDFKTAIEYQERHLKYARQLGDRSGEGRAYGNLGIAHYSLREYKTAIDYLNRSLKITRELGDRAREGLTYGNLGNAHHCIGDSKTAVDYHEWCLKIAKELGDKRGEGRAYSNLGNAYDSLGCSETAVEYHQRHLTIMKELRDRSGEGKAYGNLGCAHHSLGHFKTAIDNHTNHLKIAKELGDRSGEGEAYGNLGIAHERLGDLNTAIDYHERHLIIAKELCDRWGEGRAYGNLGNAHYNVGDFNKGKEYHKRHLNIAKELEDRSGEGRAYGSLGNAHQCLGDFKAAIEYHERHMEIAKELDDRLGEGRAYGSLGKAYFSLGDFHKAMEYHKRHLNIAKELGDRSGEGKAYGNLGNAHHSLGDFKAAIDCHERHLQIAKELNDKSGEGAAYGNLGNAYCSLGDFKPAIDYLVRDLEIAKGLGDRSGEGRTYGNLGIAYGSLGDYRAAVDYHSRHLEIAKELRDRLGEGKAYGNLGLAHHSLGEFRTAIEYHERHMKIAKELGDRWGEGRACGNLAVAYFRVGDFEQAKNYLEGDLKISKELGDRSGEGRAYGNLGVFYQGRREMQRARDYLQRNLSIAKELGDTLGEAKAYFNLGGCFEYLGQVAKAIEFYQISITLLNNIRHRLQVNDEWKISLQDQYQAIYSALWRLMLAEGKVMEALFSAEQGRAQALQDLLTLNYGIELNGAESDEEYKPFPELYSLTPPNTIFMAFGKSELVFWVCQKRGEFTLRKKISSKDEISTLIVSHDQETGARGVVKTWRFNLHEKALNTLYDIIIHPIQDLLGGSELIFIPEGPLCFAPFAAFKCPNSKYLCQSFRIRVAPSLTSLIMIAERPVDHNSGVLLVGDPWVQDVTELRPLPSAREEVEIIGRMLRCAPLTGTQATKDEVLRRLGSVALVHIAAHGSMETGEIALAPDNGEKDFMLTMKDVKRVKTRARLVVLSCCHTARGEIKAEGVVGIARAFLGAGARSVLASLWHIEDKATLKFMKNFYEHLLEGESASKALNQAMNHMRESKEFSAVEYWAPFSLIGDDVTLEFAECGSLKDQSTEPRERIPEAGDVTSAADETLQFDENTLGGEETKSRKTDSNPPEVDVAVLTNKELPKTSKRLDLEQLPIDILLLTVKDCEFLACLSLLTGFSRMFQKELGDVYIGNIGEMKIAVMKCRMGAAGPGSAAVVVRDAVKALTPKAVFCVGYCGGLQPVKVKLGDVVISEVLITYAPSKVTKDVIEERGDRVPLKPNLAKVILNAAAGWSAPLRDPAELEVEQVRGALLSGPQVVDDNDLREALLNRFPGAIAIEMEGEGVYSAAHDLNVEWIIIKGVSDFADGKNSEKNAWRPFASLMAASFVAHILSNPIIFEDWPHYNNGKTSLPPSSDQAGKRDEQPSKGNKKPVSGDKASIRDGSPELVDLGRLSKKLGRSWAAVARRLEFEEEEINDFEDKYRGYPDRAYQMLCEWKKRGGIKKATYEVLYNALTHDLVQRRDLAETFCLLTME